LRHSVCLRTSDTASVVRIRGIAGLGMKGFVIVAPQTQHAIEVTGACPGLRLEDIRVERTQNGNGLDLENSIAGLVLRGGAAGTAENPLVIRGLTLEATNVGIVIGNQDTRDLPPRHIVIEECRVDGLSRESSTALPCWPQ
jgi:hypothetical protein